MIRRALRSRTLAQSFAAATTVLVIVLVGTTLVVVRSRVAASLKEGLRAQGISLARSLAAVSTPSLLAYNYPALQLAAEGASEDPSIDYVVIHDREGNTAGSAGRETLPASVTKNLGRIPTDPVVADREVALEDDRAWKVLEVTFPVKVEGSAEPWGAVRVGMCFEPVEARLRRIVGGLVLLGISLTALAIGCGIWLARKITAPLRSLAKGTEALAAGDVKHRIPVAGAKELADLAAAFNVMMSRVEEKARESEEFQKALESLNATLENIVLERTRALEESEAQYKKLVEHSPDTILIVQGERIRFVNRAFRDVFGIAESEALADDFHLERLFDAESARLVRERIAGWESGENAPPVEVVGEDSSGRTRHLELRGCGIEYRGAPAAECLLIDTTEARRLADRLNQTEKLRALGELASGVAHDFNNLLGAILGRVQLLRRQSPSVEVDRDLAVIEKAARDGRETIRRIQEFSKTRRDRKFVPIDLAEIVRDSVEITRTRWKADADRRNISVQVVVDAEEEAPVLGQAGELREVFTNLILNAVDAMPNGGTLTIACGKEGDRIVATVSDTGIGMTEAIRKQLFDPFFTTKGSRGMGLGMSVVYGIVGRHDGKIDVSTELGRGTTFRLEFPASSIVASAVADEDGEDVRAIRKGRILVIDDEPEVAEVLRDVLVSEGHSVDMAVSAADGIHLATVTPYDIVFTDLGMPDMSGWDVAERIGQARPGVPVALVTGWGSSLDEAEARQRGVSAVVHKPFEISDLARTAARMLAETAPTGL